MNIFPKFIIETDSEEGDCLIIAKCTYHKQLATDTTKVKGGGMWSLDFENKVFTLSGRSHDFGKASLEDIANCVQRKKVFSNKALVKNLSEEFSFRYQTESGEIIDLETHKQ